MDGKIILLNGASSAGKTTLCKAIRKTVRAPFLHFSLDFFMFDADVIPKERNEPDLGITWKQMRPAVFEGFYRCLPALLSAGNNLLVDTIVENESQRDRLLNLLGPFDVFTVGVHCRLEELRRREAARGNRNPGDAENDFKTVHSFLTYDFEVDSEKSPDENAAEIIRAWSARPKKLG